MRYSQLFLLITMLLVPRLTAATSASTQRDAETEKELVRIIQSLMDAVAVGDKAVWERHVADDLIYTDENWRVLTKREILADFKPLPKGYSGSIKVSEVKSRINGDAHVRRLLVLTCAMRVESALPKSSVR